MQSITEQLDQAFRAAIRAAYDIDADPIVGTSQNEKFGDYQSNVAMSLVKRVKAKTRRAVAEQIKAKLDLGEMASEVTIAGPGFINVRLNPNWLAKQLQQVAGRSPGSASSKHRSRRRLWSITPAPTSPKSCTSGTSEAQSSATRSRGFGNLGPQGHPSEPYRRLGHAIRHADRAPAKSVRPGKYQRSKTWTVLQRGPRAVRQRTRLRRTSRGQTVVKLQGGGEEELSLWRRIVEETRRHFSLSISG